MVILIELVGWIATVFRSAGMLVRSAEKVKILVSIGNGFWLINGILTNNLPLIASNAICLIIMLIDIMRERKCRIKNKTMER